MIQSQYLGRAAFQTPGGLQAHHTPLSTPETWEQPGEAAQMGCPGRLQTQQEFFEKGPEMGQTGKARLWRLSPPPAWY